MVENTMVHFTINNPVTHCLVLDLVLIQASVAMSSVGVLLLLLPGLERYNIPIATASQENHNGTRLSYRTNHISISLTPIETKTTCKLGIYLECMPLKRFRVYAT